MGVNPNLWSNSEGKSFFFLCAVVSVPINIFHFNMSVPRLHPKHHTQEGWRGVWVPAGLDERVGREVHSCSHNGGGGGGEAKAM
jgi:hypothetical protein